MPRTDCHKKEDDINFAKRNDLTHNYIVSSTVLNFKERNGSIKAAGNRKLPFEELLQYVRAYSCFLAEGRINTEYMLKANSWAGQ